MVTALSSLSELIVDSEHKTAPVSTTGHPMIRTPNIGQGRFHLEGVRLVDDEAYEAWTRRAVPREGDLILAREAPVGNVAMIPPGMRPVLGQRTVLIRPDRAKVEPAYLQYVMLGLEVQHRMLSLSNGATVPHLNMKDIRELEIPPLPPISEQRKIAAVLMAYDELIKNNLRRIEILEEMAQAVYREWFVNFRFPGHENVAMVESPLGPIPEEWEVQRLDQIAVLHRGRSYRTANLVEEGGLPFLNLKCIDRDGGFRRSGLKRYEGPLKSHQLARTGDVVLALTDMTQERRIVARAARVPELGEPEAVLSMDLLRVEPSEHGDMSFVYSVLRFSSFPDQVKQYANGANVLHLSPDRIAEYELSFPPAELRLAFSRVLDPLLALSDKLELLNVNLRATRDLLLPKLVSGEIDVSDLDIDTWWLAS